MAITNDSITITPGTGVSVATHNPGDGKEYQVIMIANSNGQLADSNPRYRFICPTSTVGANKIHCDLFNATGSGKTMKILSAFAYVDNDTAVTGTLGVEIALTRTTAVGTGGTAAVNDGTTLTAATISRFDTNDSLVPAQITARAAPAGGATGGAYLGSRWLFTEETNAASAIAGTNGAGFIRNEGAELIVRENSGIRFIQGAVASVGSISFEINFELY